MTSGYEKTCCHLHRTRRRLQHHQHFTLHLTAASPRGWNWQKESQWRGLTNQWTERKNIEYCIVQYEKACQHFFFLFSVEFLLCVRNVLI